MFTCVCAQLEAQCQKLQLLRELQRRLVEMQEQTERGQDVLLRVGPTAAAEATAALLHAGLCAFRLSCLPCMGSCNHGDRVLWCAQS